jgi:Tfp pilus assembly protein PilE
MFKNNKGVTLIILAITLVIMLIIFGITLSSADDLLRNTQKNKLKTNLLLIQARASSLLEDYLFVTTIDYSSSTITYDTYQNDKTNIEQYLGGSFIVKNKFQTVKSLGFESSNTTFSGKYIYCEWTLETLKKQGISTDNIKNEDSFIIQYNLAEDTVDVASQKGYSDGNGNSYHLLSQL